VNKIEQNFSEKEIRDIIASSLSVTEAARKFGYLGDKPKLKMTKEIIQKYNIDTSHFRAKTKIDDFPINEIIEKISKAKCYKEALCSFGYSG
jgi:hypothetical protein